MICPFKENRTWVEWCYLKRCFKENSSNGATHISQGCNPWKGCRNKGVF